jgi:hypothetical protein
MVMGEHTEYIARHIKTDLCFGKRLNVDNSAQIEFTNATGIRNRSCRVCRMIPVPGYPAPAHYASRAVPASGDRNHPTHSTRTVSYTCCMRCPDSPEPRTKSMLSIFLCLFSCLPLVNSIWALLSTFRRFPKQRSVLMSYTLDKNGFVYLLHEMPGLARASDEEYVKETIIRM